MTDSMEYNVNYARPNYPFIEVSGKFSWNDGRVTGTYFTKFTFSLRVVESGGKSYDIPTLTIRQNVITSDGHEIVSSGSNGYFHEMRRRSKGWFWRHLEFTETLEELVHRSVDFYVLRNSIFRNMLLEDRTKEMYNDFLDSQMSKDV